MHAFSKVHYGIGDIPKYTVCAEQINDRGVSPIAQLSVAQ
ncbi:hypothetical protein FHW00_004954 [Ochrobactrum sp. P6BSIII]|nr:hypothetical protein [Ochrobactrum sp. P6BSIII]